MRKMLKLFLCSLMLLGFAGFGHAAEETESLVRIIHASPDAPPLDVYANDERIIQGLDYSDVSEYFLVPPSTHKLEIKPADDESTVLISEEILVEEGTNYTLAAVGHLETIQLATMTDDQETLEGKTKIRLAHFSPDASALELATPIGNELFQEVTFTEVTDYMELDAGLHDFELHIAGTDDAVVEIYDLDMKEGAVFTAFVMGLVNGVPELEVILLTDYMPMPNDIPKTGLGGASPVQ
ncbi:DUF4397 domain-containing protein [Halalkalibacter urbisdiaboli]|uniref:DUF4397 domain-containing protein n=1 Tax=Halalkalibacter urbisdiaboli TaxID=1960589 RepID=UPI000B42DDB8|nr:DUF4397 domain-containing protein [Halalkalibacter urbisdiaboli]